MFNKKTRQQLWKRLHNQGFKITHDELKFILKESRQLLVDTLEEERKVTIPGFGKFVLEDYKSDTVFSPFYGERVKRTRTKRILFTANAITKQNICT